MHSDMMAKVKVVDSAFIARVEHGRFTFTNVPPGTYKVVAWTPDSPEVKSPQAVTVTAGAAVELSASLDVQLVTRSGCHERKDGTPYPGPYAKCPPDRYR
jgi:hypothetical protein